MRFTNIVFSAWVAASLVLCSADPGNELLQKRQDNASGFPTLGSGNTQASSQTATATASNSDSRSATVTNAPSSATRDGTIVPTQNTNITSTIPPSTSLSANTPRPTITSAANATADATTDNSSDLPLPPSITPALSIGGVVLLLTGIAYALIGVKNRWVHIFLSTAYLTSLSITVLIIYVLNPPVSNAIQGAYFVGIFMTGVIFGGGALIFKEVTEGLGCLLGGFCLAMWFLTLKEGGLITSTGGKAIFISAFCVVSWSLSFSHYTRAYGLIASIAFSGATVFVLGIDCFSRAGLKEFWLYIWELNENLFPLNTDTYPISRGTRVETIIIVFACIIGVVSQMKLWKVVKDRQSRRNAEHEEENRRRDAVEVALGRHLERQNDRDRSQWEKQYGDRLTAKRETILWTEAHGEKGYSKLKETELDTHNHPSVESLEMTNMPKKPRSVYVAKSKRQSMPVTSIPELEEGEATNKADVRQKVLDRLEGNSSHTDVVRDSIAVGSVKSSPRLSHHSGGESPGFAENPDRDSKRISQNRKSLLPTTQPEKRNSDLQKYLSAPEEEKQKKRRSFTSYLSRSSKVDDDHRSFTQSQEALVVPEVALRHSRASSLAATLDFENENLDHFTIDTDIANDSRTPDIVISPVNAQHSKSFLPHSRNAPSSEPELVDEHLELDPEEFVRSPTELKRDPDRERRMSSGPSSVTKRQSGSEFDADGKSRAATSETSQSEVLTKGALEAMPSQLSHVVMSYRTNEWAKHISAAEEPLVEEPEPITDDGTESEPPTHLADPTEPHESKRSSINQAPPPQIPLPTPSAVSSATEGIRVNPAIQPEQVPFSAVVPAQPVRSRSASEIAGVPRGLRSTSTPMLVKQALQTPVISENAAFDFSPQQHTVHSSAQSLMNYNPNASPTILRPATSASNLGMQRSVSRLSLVSEHGMMPARSGSQMSNYQQFGGQPLGPYQHNPYQGQFNTMPARLDTRMQSYDSHQPLQRNASVENQRREARLNDWHGTPKQLASIQDPAEIHRQQMLMERQQMKMMEEQEKNYKRQQEMHIEQRMRGRDMQELHREAMRKMQANANKKMTN